MLIWRGMGIAVPIIFFIAALLVRWLSGDPDTSLGNPSFIGWTSLFSAIVVFLLGLVALGSGEGKDDQGNTVKKKHDFFFIPVIVWGLLLGGLSVYLLVFVGKKAKADPTTALTTAIDSSATIMEEPRAPRKVNFYNPTKDSLSYFVSDENGDGLIEKGKVGPHSYATAELAEQTYFMFARDKNNKLTLSLPAEEDAADSTRFVLFEDDKGQFYQRVVVGATKETDDYDEAWLVLDGKTDLLLVDVTNVCNATVTKAEVGKMKWDEKIKTTYPARDLIEPLFMERVKDKVIKVLAPEAEIPTEIAANAQYYLLIPNTGGKDQNAMIAKAITAARF